MLKLKANEAYLNALAYYQVFIIIPSDQEG
jgi:hypothetical protein